MKLLIITLTILQSLFSTLEQKTLQSDFSITITQEQTQPMTYAGTLAMRDQKFALEFFGIEAAYDGQTLYMYNEDAEELTQDVFLKAFQQLSSFKAESSFSTWIYRIATNVAISAVRKKRNDVLRLDDSVFANLSDTQVDEALENESEEQMERLQQAMNQLEADERALITLYYLEEKPLAEVAFILGMTEGNAKVKLHRIRKKLYVLIKNQE